MKALILAAGRGRRLGAGVEAKCLLDMGGQTLLERMLRALAAVGVESACVVVGHAEAAVVGELERLRGVLPWETVTNARYTEGSVVSLWTGREVLGTDDVVVMDADVLFGVPLLRRLVESAHESAFLLDPRAEASGEEMMLAARGGRVERIARQLGEASYEVVGEGVGFLKVGRRQGAALRRAVEAMVDAGEVGRDYENAVDRFLGEERVGYELVGGSPWTEIDFAEDVERARAQVLPALEDAGSS